MKYSYPMAYSRNERQAESETISSNLKAKIVLNHPKGFTSKDSMNFALLTKRISKMRLNELREHLGLDIGDETNSSGYSPEYQAACLVIWDLCQQGWFVESFDLSLVLSRPSVALGAEAQKVELRRQELVRRNEQLVQPSVQSFIAKMEKPKKHKGKTFTISSLVEDGQALITRVSEAGESVPVQPYIQFVDQGTCRITGLKLQDIWRYFRLTWSSPYSTVPGRSIGILIRDAAGANHPVIGLAALSSPVMQISVRDRWIGWANESIVQILLSLEPNLAKNWVSRVVQRSLEEVDAQDFLDSGKLSALTVIKPDKSSVKSFRDYSLELWKAYGSSVSTGLQDSNDWHARSRSDLFTAKRALLLAELLELKLTLEDLIEPSGRSGIEDVITNKKQLAELNNLIRRARAARVGSIVADLTVCGAIAPYNLLTGGKLVAALAISPKVISHYSEKYRRPSEISSSLAGRAVIRESRLSAITTTSLYGSGSSQYNRLRIPASAFGLESNKTIDFENLGKSLSFGSSQFSDTTVNMLTKIARAAGTGGRMSGAFGEGGSPRLRKVRAGLAALGWDASQLMRHGRNRIVYGVALVENLTEYSIGLTDDPQGYIATATDFKESQVANWWWSRWAKNRMNNEDILKKIKEHNSLDVRPTAG